jgi:hypothetical protein
MELAVGAIAVGFLLGMLMGSRGSRARRSHRDWSTAKGALKKAKTIMFAEFGRAIVTGLILAAIFVGAVTLAFGGGTGQ